MIEKKWVVGPFGCNCRLFACPETGEAALVDPGDEPSKILAGLEGLKTPGGAPLKIKYLLHTHGHLDHVGGTRLVKERLINKEGLAPLVAIHKDDEPLYQALPMQGRLFQIHYDAPLPVDLRFEHEQDLEIGKMKIQVIHTPGHSPGSVCLRFKEDSSVGVPELLLTGDTLFRGSVGRTDLWGGDHQLMFKNIRERILNHDDEIRVCPGHGPDTTIGLERRENEFLS